MNKRISSAKRWSHLWLFVVLGFLAGQPSAFAHMGDTNLQPEKAQPVSVRPHFFSAQASHDHYAKSITVKPVNSGLIWSRLKSNFKLNFNAYHPAVQFYIKKYTQNPKYLRQFTKQATPFLYMIMDDIEQRHLPGELALLPIVESAYDPFVLSPVDAAGLWQIMPATGRHLGLKHTHWYDGRRDVKASTTAALNYLEHLVSIFHGDWLLALASYNSGEGTVHRAIVRNKYHHRDTDFWSLRLPRETKNYVPKLLAIATIISSPERYHVKLSPIMNKPFLAPVKVSKHITIEHAARLAKMPLKTVYRYNAGYNRFVKYPKSNYELLLPVHNAKLFHTNYVAHSHHRLTPHHATSNGTPHVPIYLVKAGDTLSGIAHTYSTSVATLRAINNMNTHYQLKAGEKLALPSAANNGTARAIHIVRKGDSLWKIGKKYGVQLDKILKWNALGPKSFLKPGQKIVLFT